MNNRGINFSKQLYFRSSWLVLGLVFFLLIIIVRLVDIQLFRGSFFLELADDNRYFEIRIPAERGVFFDRYNQALTWNQRTYLQVEDTTAIYAPARSISRQQALRLLATDSAQVKYGIERHYSFPKSIAHVLGYVGPVTLENLLNDSSLKVSDIIGKIGLEQVFDQQLRGQAGAEVYEINALGKRQRLISQQAGHSGQNISTSLDPYLSSKLLDLFEGQIGAGVIMDAKTSEVLSLISSPSFDANTLSIHFSDLVLEKQRQVALQAMLSDPLQVFFNRGVSGTYPPGSVFKLVTALGGLEGKVLDDKTTVVDEGVLRVGEYEYTNWYYTQFGRTEGEIGLQKALARSNDIFFYKVAQWLGPNKLAEFARLFGLGKVTGIELSGEASGIVPDPAWKEQVTGESWYLGNTFHMGIGQGDVLVTPLQVAQFTQAVVNHGTLCEPTLLKQVNGKCGELGVLADNLDLVLSGMLDVCSPGGTAYPFFIYNQTHRPEGQSANEQIRGGAMACKTGTSEFGGADERGYRDTHGWFTGVIGTAEIKDLAKKVAAGDREAIDGIRDRQVAREESEVAVEGEKELDYLEWLKLIDKHGFPDKLVITVLVESDDDNPYKEGSRDAGLVTKGVVDWMLGK
ncbi:MAG: penicillin-binding transpeptidase domain-containing protein [Patescibacteria group bacterium]